MCLEIVSKRKLKKEVTGDFFYMQLLRLHNCNGLHIMDGQLMLLSYAADFFEP